MNLATLLRLMQFYAHIAHNKLGGETFFQDHAFLGELYAGYESDYDDVVERMIGLGEKVDLIEIHKKAADSLYECESYKECFKELLDMEKDLCDAIEKLVKDSSEGTKQLIGGIADKSEMRQYKIKQRLKG